MTPASFLEYRSDDMGEMILVSFLKHHFGDVGQMS
jgi:hypothetical protein